MKLIYSTPQDYGAVLDAANKIFTLREDDAGNATYDNRFFQELQPKIYQSEQVMPPHLLAYEGDKLVGMAAIHKSILQMGSEQLTLYGIGTVGVLQEYRGRGLMQAMMERINRDLKEANADLAELGGKRKRYSHFGYTTGGIGADITLAQEEFSEAPEADYRFVEDGIWTADELSFLCRLHQAQPVYTERTPELLQTTLRTGKRRALKILLDGRCVGCCSVNSSYENLVELNLEPEQNVLSVLRAYTQAFSLRHLSLLNFSPLWLAQHPDIMRRATSVSLREQERYRIFRYQNVLQAGLSAKHAMQALCPGELTLSIENYGTVSVRIGRDVQVEMTDSPADLELSEEDAVHLLMGAPALLGANTHLPAFAAGWFPLHIHTLSNDRI